MSRVVFKSIGTELEFAAAECTKQSVDGWTLAAMSPHPKKAGWVLLMFVREEAAHGA